MINYIKTITGFLFLLSILSCKKYLEAKPDSSITTPETLEDLQALLDRADYMNQRSLSFDEASSDDYFLLPSTYNQAGSKGQTAYTWQFYSDEWAYDWSNAYLVVYHSNVCLETLKGIERTQLNHKDWDSVKGSALFYRAHSFLKLAWTFAKAYDNVNAGTDYGIVLRLGTDFNVPSDRASVKDTYRQIIQDLEMAIPLLPEVPQHVMRPSKAAVYGLLARTYLSMRQYDLAYQYSDLCLKIKSELIDYNSIDLAAPSPFQNFNAEVIFHADIRAYSYPVNPMLARVDTLLYRSYDDNDLRKKCFFTTSNNYQQFKGSYVSATPFSKPLFMGIATDEMLLVRAECEARTGDYNMAMADLNTLMKKRWDNKVVYKDIIANNAEEALNLILSERRRELLFRGLRWIDIKRLNKEGANISLKRIIGGKEYNLEPNDNRFALPIPADIVELTGIPQNDR